MDELVVGVDGSPESRPALQWAASLATATGIKLRLVEAWTGGDPAAADEGSERIRHDLAAAATSTLGGPVGSVDIDFEALRGSAAAALMTRVTPNSGLILGSRGRGGFAGLLLGSVSRECVEYASAPVIIVRQERPTPSGQAPILVGHDGSLSSRRALDWAVELAELTQAEVIAAYVWQTTASEVRPRLHRRLRASAGESIQTWSREVSPRVRPMEIEGEPRMALVDLAGRLNAALLAVGRRGKGTVRALRMGSVASYLVTNSPVPIAIIPPPPSAEPS
jgi:nucleotide-binding universal stress UspA family protein